MVFIWTWFNFLMPELFEGLSHVLCLENFDGIWPFEARSDHGAIAVK
ncbi:unnamed protein product [Acidithrix sp. C25]|nr:unnamed protein product [Acidithrix sp. C25]